MGVRDMRALLIVVIAALGLSACATQAKYESALNTWIGHTETELVSAWGPPVRVYQVPSGGRILTYYRGSTMVLPGTPATYQSTVSGNTVYTTQTGGSPPVDLQLSCTTNFTIVDGRVQSWHFQGNNCVSR